jgi:hypothetical protein
VWLSEGFATYARWLWMEQAGLQRVDDAAANALARTDALRAAFGPPDARTTIVVRSPDALRRIREIEGDIDSARREYRENVLHLRERYMDRYGAFGRDDPAFVVGAVSCVKRGPNGTDSIDAPAILHASSAGVGLSLRKT